MLSLTVLYILPDFVSDGAGLASSFMAGSWGKGGSWAAADMVGPSSGGSVFTVTSAARTLSLYIMLCSCSSVNYALNLGSNTVHSSMKAFSSRD